MASSTPPNPSASARPNDPTVHDYASTPSPPPQDEIQASPAPASPLPRNRLRTARPVRQVVRRSPSIRLRRPEPYDAIAPANNVQAPVERADSGRRRSSSEPQRPSFLTPGHQSISRQRSVELSPMPCVDEEPRGPGSGAPTAPTAPVEVQHLQVPGRGSVTGVPVERLEVVDENGVGVEALATPATPMLTPAGTPEVKRRSLLMPFGRKRAVSTPQEPEDGEAPADEYETQVVDMLDVIDPEISTLSTLTNVQNSLFIPNLGTFLNRRPTYMLTRRGPDPEADADTGTVRPDYTSTLGRTVTRLMTMDDVWSEQETIQPQLSRQGTRNSITSTLTDSYYAVLPHGVSLQGWTENEKEELNDHVRHMLHSRRAKMKRGLKGFGQYVKRPLGFFVTLYATLITLFGLAWVLFLIGWISVGSKQLYVINVIDYVLVALFAIMGDGLAPFRAVDTYHMIYIAHYHHLTWSLRKKQRLPKLQDHNDLPRNLEGDPDPDAEEKEEESEEFSVLTPKQQANLDHHAAKFAKSHTFYKPHETETHNAFPLRLLVAVVVLLDFHSIFQIALGACTWGIDYKNRPFALTTVILCCSLTCNITAGILISVGDHRTRKKDVVERMFRQTLTQEAMKKVEKRREKEEREELEKARQRQKDWLAHKEAEQRKSMDQARKSTDRIRRSAESSRSKINLPTPEVDITVTRPSSEWVRSPQQESMRPQGLPTVNENHSNPIHSASPSHDSNSFDPTASAAVTNPNNYSMPFPPLDPTDFNGSQSETPWTSSSRVVTPTDSVKATDSQARLSLDKKDGKKPRNKLYKPTKKFMR